MQRITRKKSSLKFHILLWIFFIPFVLSAQIFAVELDGSVTGVNGEMVIIQLNGESIPAIGDMASLYLEHEVLGEMSIGTWKVTKVNYPEVHATKMDATGEAKVGVKTVIQALNPIPAKSKESLKTLQPDPAKAAINEALITAVKKGSLSDVKKALQNGADINCKDLKEDAWFPLATPLCIAAEKKQFKIIEMLLSRGADPLIEDKFGRNALGYAILSKDLDIINIFLNKGVTLNSSTLTGISPLHIAAERDSGWKIFAHLIGSGADVNARIRQTAMIPKEIHGATPLIFLTGQTPGDSEVEAVLLLLLAGADPSIRTVRGNTALDEIRITKELLLKKDHSPEDSFVKNAIRIEKILKDTVWGKREAKKIFQDELADAVDDNDINSLMALDAIGFDLSRALKNQNSLLGEAIAEGKFKMAKLLLKYGANPVVQDEDGRTPFLAAVYKGHMDFVKLFYEKGADPNDIPWGADSGMLHFVHEHVKENKMELIKYLISIGADPNWRDEEYNTPLHIAARDGDARFFELLIDNGANPRIQNRGKKRAIDLVPSSKRSEFNRIQDKVWPPASTIVKTIESLEITLTKAKDSKDWTLSKKTANGLIDMKDPVGFYIMGIIYSKGLGVKIDHKKAFGYFKQGSQIESIESYNKNTRIKVGDQNLYYYLGLYYEIGLGGVPENHKEAIHWYKKAIKKGSIRANYRLGKMVLNGFGVKKDPYRAFVLIKSAAVQGRGYAEAIYWLGYLYENGIGTSKNIKKAKDLFETAKERGFKKDKIVAKKAKKDTKNIEKLLGQAYQKLRKGKDEASLSYIKDHAHQDSTTAQYYLALAYYYGTGNVEKNQKIALAWFLKAGAKGYAKAQDYLGDMYDNGYGTPKNIDRAIHWYTKAAENNIKYSQVELGIKNRKGEGVKQNYTTALKWFHKAAEQEYPRAQDEIGYMYEKGYGVEKSDAIAAQWYKKAAEQGYKFSQYTLGLFYKNGWGVTKSYSNALKWYKKAADQGYDEAQNDLGIMYDHGQGVEGNDVTAVMWYKKAAEQGFDIAQNNLGLMYARGHGVAKNELEARKWFMKAAEQGYDEAQFNMGVMYSFGRGVPKDNARAIKWYKKAAKQGHANAQKNLELLQ